MHCLWRRRQWWWCIWNMHTKSTVLKYIEIYLLPFYWIIEYRDGSINAISFYLIYRQLWSVGLSGGMWNIMQTRDEKNNNNDTDDDSELNTRYKIECKMNEHVCEIWDFWMEKISLSDLHELWVFFRIKDGQIKWIFASKSFKPVELV